MLEKKCQLYKVIMTGGFSQNYRTIKYDWISQQ